MQRPETFRYYDNFEITSALLFTILRYSSVLVGTLRYSSVLLFCQALCIQTSLGDCACSSFLPLKWLASELQIVFVLKGNQSQQARRTKSIEPWNICPLKHRSDSAASAHTALQALSILHFYLHCSDLFGKLCNLAQAESDNLLTGLCFLNPVTSWAERHENEAIHIWSH